MRLEVMMVTSVMVMTGDVMVVVTGNKTRPDMVVVVMVVPSHVPMMTVMLRLLHQRVVGRYR
jgi:hypothetical protein